MPASHSAHDSSVRSQPYVSVIMIFLNAERFMEEAVASVFAQTYEAWELLLVDDGSTDRSSLLARQLMRAHPDRVRYLEHPNHDNLGMSASRNLGIRHARGTYIAFLDADDVYLPRKLERQVATLNAQPEAAMVYGPTLEWYSWTHQPIDGNEDSLRRLGVSPGALIKPPALPKLFLEGTAQTPCTCGVLVRKEAIRQVGGFEPQFEGMFEDQVFFYKLCLNRPVFVMGECLDRYRQHPDSTFRTSMQAVGYNYQRSHAYHEFLQWLEEYIKDEGLLDAGLATPLARALRPFRHPLWYALSAPIRQGLRLLNGSGKRHSSRGT